ncbi:HlyD family secretion protein [Fulvivirga sediminis]|uniref:HlyD family efflux transporter periplasmic adaptor subunit n=1 Tax=Fulvivirga sediminis TaxID=2803949 RepID=A0A937K127_9BACT|nr:HlyD family efflux transporter periplasmic adaptor subunit [Fulvivirga sediminis]MBL3657011.1 HlyD family efflux transporter periplasmic adaptor subunit [Fulvivirga sediminis]
MPNIDNIRLRSEEVQEILSDIPHWLIRWGITVIFVVLGVIIISSWFIKYPDTASARLIFTSETPPVHLVSMSAGKLLLQTADKQKVEENTILGVIENPASYKDVMSLEQHLKDMKSEIYNYSFIGKSAELDQSLNVGSLQNIYFSFTSAVEDAKRFSSISFYKNQRLALSKRMKYYEELNDGLHAQIVLVENEIKIAESIYKDDSLLFKQRAGTKPEMNKSKSNYLASKRNKENLQSSIIQNSIQIAEIRSQIDELQLKEIQEIDKLKANVIVSYERLESELMAWKQQYLLISPMAGRVSFSKFWSDNQFVQTGEEVMTVIPLSEKVIGNVSMPILGSGKIKTGQRVNIKVDNYPSNEYGMIVGRVESIALVPRDDTYNIRISFPNGLTSNYNQILAFRPEMQGTADIITEDKRLIERVFNQFSSILYGMD